MLAHDKRINAAGGDARLGCYGAAQTRGVEEGAAADYLAGGQAGVLEGEVGEDIDWVGDEEEDGGGVEGFHVVDYAGEDGLVAADEVGAGFSWKGDEVRKYTRDVKELVFDLEDGTRELRSRR